jgi:hypothetical protein
MRLASPPVARRDDVREVVSLLAEFPVVAIIGARQVGKTTLARAVAARLRRRGGASFDLEDPRDLARLDDPMRALAELRGLVVLDEVQRRPELFPALRVLADRPRGARFLVLGSASPALLRQSSESLAGRIAVHELQGFGLRDVGARALRRLHVRGGFPRSFLAKTDAASLRWRDAFRRTFVERDLPQLVLEAPAAALERVWAMLAHVHGSTLNSSELGRSLGVADTTVRRYLDLLAGTFAVRLLPPWHENISKRQVKAPKVYVSDSGMLHSLLGIADAEALDRHPKAGASWEGFCIAEVARRLGARREECYFWATHAGAELDLLVVRGRRRLGFEVKYTSAPSITPSMRIALADLRLERLDVVHAGEETFPLGERVRALAARRIPVDLKPLSQKG